LWQGYPVSYDHVSFLQKEVTPKYYNPLDPEKAKKIKLVLAVLGFIVVLILMIAVKR